MCYVARQAQQQQFLRGGSTPRFFAQLRSVGSNYPAGRSLPEPNWRLPPRTAAKSPSLPAGSKNKNPLSNWTELDIWQYIRLENIPIVPLYFAKERPIVEIDGNLIMADDDRLPEKYRDKIQMRKVRFRTLGCWPLTGAVDSEADTIEKIAEEMITSSKSERTTRVFDFDQDSSMEQKKREGYF